MRPDLHADACEPGPRPRRCPGAHAGAAWDLCAHDRSATIRLRTASGTSWTREALERSGFEGWLSFEALASGIDSVPRRGGVYVVVQAAASPPSFLEANPGGRFKGRDPSVAPEALAANWVEGAEVVYIGKADQLRRPFANEPHRLAR